MAFHIQPRKFEPGDYIVREGERLEEVYFVYHGRDGVGTVGVGPLTMKHGEEVHKPVLYYKKPMIIGEYAILMQKPAVTTYRVYEDKTLDVFAVPRRPFMDLLETYYPEDRDVMLGYSQKKAKHIQDCIEKEMKSMSRSRTFGS